MSTSGYACSLAILLSGVVSYFFFGLEMSLQFLVGASMVMGSVYLNNADGMMKPAATSTNDPSSTKGLQKV